MSDLERHDSPVAGAPGDVAPPDPLQLAVRHHRRGQLKQAKVLYELLLGRDPHHFAALCLLGMVESRLKHFDAAAALFRRAMALRPGYHRDTPDLPRVTPPD